MKRSAKTGRWGLRGVKSVSPWEYHLTGHSVTTVVSLLFRKVYFKPSEPTNVPALVFVGLRRGALVDTLRPSGGLQRGAGRRRPGSKRCPPPVPPASVGVGLRPRAPPMRGGRQEGGGWRVPPRRGAQSRGGPRPMDVRLPSVRRGPPARRRS